VVSSFPDRSLLSPREPESLDLLCVPSSPPIVTYSADKLQGVASGLLAFPYTHPIQVGWCSRNAGAVASRTVNASLYNM